MELNFGHKVPVLATVIAAGLVVVGCAYTGRIYVSTPQVNTRERLVARRVEESEWLRRQLTNSDNIVTTFQGVEDFRQFAGFFAQARASFDPSQGALATGELNNQLLAQETEQWRLRKINLDAKNDYFQALSATNREASTNAGASSSTTHTSNNTASVSLPTPTADPFSSRPELPSPTNIVQTQAKAGLLDLLHDKMAYRSEVVSAIKSVELDDSHDLAGMMLYDLNFNITIVPGDDSERLAQVKISLQNDAPITNRVAELRRLFPVWKDELQADLIREAADLQFGLRYRRLNQNDQRLLQWFLVSQLPALRSRLEQESEAVKALQSPSSNWSNVVKTAAHKRIFYLLTPELVKGRNDPSTVQSELGKVAAKAQTRLSDVQELERAFNRFNARALLSLLDNITNAPIGLDQPEGVLLLKAIPWAVWTKYRDMLGRIVLIEPPKTQLNAATDPVALGVSGLTVNELGIISGHTRTGTVFQASSAFDKEAEKVDPSTGISDTGELTFVLRLLEREGAAYAASVDPKEYAQNISEVSARERMLNLIGAVQAAFPSAGVKADAQMQYLRRRQELLHGIERRPLASGFGMGSTEFGWVLGPKFDIEKGKKQFKHTTIRHDFSAAIVIPAWFDRVSLKGEFAWIQSDGSLGSLMPLWAGKSVMNRSVPLPRDAFRRITQALVANRPANEPFLFTSRPYPVVVEPSADNPVALGTNSANFVIVIRGRELWRNPQVFLGNQQAQSVRVLSDMDGLIAEFTTPLDQSIASFPLKVVTTFGEYNVPSAVRRSSSGTNR